MSYELEHLSYGEMECRSNQLGRYLQRLGVGPEVKVVVCMNRAPEMLIAILGIMKAGGAYAPIDPAYPSKRAQGIVEDSQARIIISQQELVDRLGLEASRTISLDRESARNSEGEQATGNQPCLRLTTVHARLHSAGQQASRKA